MRTIMKKLFAKLLGISSSLFNFYLPIFRELVATGLAALLPIALEVVTALAKTDKTGAEKRSEALNTLRDAAIQRGINASESLLRYTVEAAVQKLKVS
jgi:hypothetical protein